MAYTFSQLQDIKNRVVRDLAAQQAAMDSAKGQFTTSKTALAAMGATYTQWATDVNALAVANPSNAAALALKAEKDALVLEFNTATTRATALETAVNGI